MREYAMLTMRAEVVPLHKEHKQRIEFFMLVDYPEQVTWI